MPEYGTDDIQRLFGLGPSTLKTLRRAGHVTAAATPAGFHFSFRDLVLLRTVGALLKAKVSSRKIHRALRALRQSLPLDHPMSGVALDGSGGAIAVREAGQWRELDSNQYALPLDMPAPPPHLSQPPVPPSADHSDLHFLRGLDLEDSNPRQARRAYERCLALDSAHLEARINLGRLLHLAGSTQEAEKVYRAASETHPLLAFNLAVLLEDLGRTAHALEQYQQAVALEPQLADAHFNLARLYGEAGDARAALRHMLAYRRLTQPVSRA